MFYDYDDYFEEPNEFEMQIEEFKNSLRNTVKEEIKGKIETLEKELAELKTFRDEKDKFVKECETKIKEANQEATKAIREAKEAEEKWKNARLCQLLGDYLTAGWKVDSSYKYGKKCKKCDDNRKIQFTSPQGKEYEEDCECAKKHYEYFPEEVQLLKFYVRKKNFRDDNKKIDFYNRYYIAKDNGDYDCYKSANYVYTSSDIDFEEVSAYSGVFLNKDDCQKYCDWKNEQERKKAQ